MVATVCTKEWRRPGLALDNRCGESGRKSAGAKAAQKAEAGLAKAHRLSAMLPDDETFSHTARQFDGE